MAPYRWSHNKPTRPGWYWFRGLAHEADPFIVLVDQAGEFQWPDGGFQEVSLATGEWAGPIEEPEESIEALCERDRELEVSSIDERQDES